jgi:hypothetical protein
MATYFVASGASNTVPYDTWAKAATSLATALAAASSAGDIVVIQYDAVPSGDAENSADVTYTFAADSVSLISASNGGGSTWTPTAMGTANWIGNSTTNRSVSFSGVDLSAYIYGLTIRTAGSTVDSINLANSAGQAVFAEDCYFWSGNTASSTRINLTVTDANAARVKNCTFRFGATGQALGLNGANDIEGCTVSSSGSTPTTLVGAVVSGKSLNRWTGCDLSLVTGTLLPSNSGPMEHVFERCKLGSGVTVLATQTGNPTLASTRAWVLDCASGDTQGFFGYYNAIGQVTSDTGIYYTGGAAAQSWKIVTSSLASFANPFVTPWVDLYHTGTSSITPRFEILRDGSSTAYTNAEVWAEFSALVTSGSMLATIYSDRCGLSTTPAAQTTGAGTGSWTGEGGTAWSGKCDSGSSLTPAESGYLRGRISVSMASATVYVDPQIRT